LSGNSLRMSQDLIGDATRIQTVNELLGYLHSGG
jgi:hypothetical protein